MNFLMYLSNMIIPFVVFYIVVYGFVMQKNVYEDFIRGAESGLKTVVKIAPTIVGLMVGVGVLRASGFLQCLSKLIGSVTEHVGIDGALVPVMIIRMFSSSAATGLILDIFKEYGTDSYIGLCTSIMASCTETIFYTMSVYFLAAKVNKTKWTLKGALFSTFAGIVTSIFLAKML